MKAHIENIIIGSLLADRGKLRDCAALDASTMSAENKALYKVIRSSCSDRPIEEVQPLAWMLGVDVVCHAFEVYALCDFDILFGKYKNESTVRQIMGERIQFQTPTFADYVSRYIRLSYGSTPA